MKPENYKTCELTGIKIHPKFYFRLEVVVWLFFTGSIPAVQGYLI